MTINNFSELSDHLESVDDVLAFLVHSIKNANPQAKKALADAIRFYAETDNTTAPGVIGAFIIEALEQYTLAGMVNPPGPDPIDDQEPPEPDPYYEDSKYETSS